MQKFSFKHISKGFSFLGKNPQIIYTIFLLIVIPCAFLISSQWFLKVAKNNQEKLERDRIGLMQDIFVGFATSFVDNSIFLQEQINAIQQQNPTITDFKVLKREGENYQIIASFNSEEIGQIDDDGQRVSKYNFARSGEPLIFPAQKSDGRHWQAFRTIKDKSSNTIGMIYTDVSMAHIDTLLKEGVKKAYLLLFFIIIIISILLIRQAKVIDYAVLYKKLQEVDNMKDDFISMAAHELRTPLTVIREYAELLTESKRLTDNDKQLTSRISLSANQLGQMINDILDVSRLQQGRLSFKMEKTTPSVLVDEVIQSLQYMAEKKGLILSYQKNKAPFVKIDSDRFKQTLINIIGNAIKYTPKGSVTVTTYVERDSFYVRISDTGLGISAEDQKKLFARFFRVKSRETERIRGTGLGLWITKTIIEQMNGKINVESIKDKGTDFILVFPVCS